MINCSPLFGISPAEKKPQRARRPRPHEDLQGARVDSASTARCGRLTLLQVTPRRRILRSHPPAEQARPS